MVDAMREGVKRRRLSVQERYVRKEVWEVTRDKVMASELEEGFARLAAVRECLESLEEDGESRSANQRFLHKVFDAVCARMIFGAGFDEAKVMEHEGWVASDMVQTVNLVTPRRWGKTTLCAMYAFALLQSIPGIRIAVFAPSEEQSAAIIKAVLALLAKKAPNQKFSTNSKVCLTLNFGRTDQRTITAHSSNTDVRYLSLSLSRLSLSLFLVSLFLVSLFRFCRLLSTRWLLSAFVDFCRLLSTFVSLPLFLASPRLASLRRFESIRFVSLLRPPTRLDSTPLPSPPHPPPRSSTTTIASGPVPRWKTSFLGRRM
jgi:hypothetical protein